VGGLTSAATKFIGVVVIEWQRVFHLARFSLGHKMLYNIPFHDFDFALRKTARSEKLCVNFVGSVLNQPGVPPFDGPEPRKRGTPNFRSEHCHFVV
jgi:hypothetical protein